MGSRRSKANPKKAPSVEKRSGSAVFALGTFLVVATFAAHFPAVFAGYTWDDDLWTYGSPLATDPNGLYRSWFTAEATDYWPVTRTMFWIEWRIWGNNPKPYHIANIALHALSAVVLWRVMKRLNVGGLSAFLAGLIFAIHPVTVESVAWISERKNVLSMVLYLLAIMAYLRFEDERRRTWYVLALLATTAAMLAKSSVVMLPVVLLLLVWWKRNSIARRDLFCTAPFFVISLILGLVTIWFQHHKAIADVVVRPEGLTSRIASVGWVVWFYLYKTVLPVNLAMIYSRWDVDGGRVLSFIPLVLLIACFVAFFWYRSSWGRAPLAALGAFVVVLAPVVGLLDMAFAVHSLVADHLQYPAMPATMALMSGGIAAMWSWARQKDKRGLAPGIATVAGAACLTLAVLTWRQSRVYQDEVALWTHTLQLNDRAWAAYDHRGHAYGGRGDHGLAIRDYTKVIELKPDYAKAHYNRGYAYSRMGDHDLAIRDYTKAIELKPDYAEAYNNRGNAYGGKGDHDLAIQDYSKVIEFTPNFAEVYNNRGNAYGGKGDHDLAVRDFTKVIELKPDCVEAYKNRAFDYCCLKAYDEAWADVRMLRRLGGAPHPDLLRKLTEASGRTE